MPAGMVRVVLFSCCTSRADSGTRVTNRVTPPGSADTPRECRQHQPYLRVVGGVVLAREVRLRVGQVRGDLAEVPGPRASRRMQRAPALDAPEV
jgi:hypothetical protein